MEGHRLLDVLKLESSPDVDRYRVERARINYYPASRGYECLNCHSATCHHVVALKSIQAAAKKYRKAGGN